MRISQGDTVSAEQLNDFFAKLQDAVRSGAIHSFTPSIHFDGAYEIETTSPIHHFRFEKINDDQFYCSRAA